VLAERAVDLKLQSLGDVRRSRLELGVKEHAAVAVAVALELQSKVEVLVVFLGAEIAVFLRDSDAVNHIAFHFPLFIADLLPAGQVPAVEQRLPVLTWKNGPLVLLREQKGRAEKKQSRTHDASIMRSDMRAVAIDYNTRRLGEREVPEPRIEHPDDVLFQVRQVGVCGTDRELAAYRFGHGPSGDSFLRQCSNPAISSFLPFVAPANLRVLRVRGAVAICV
jgi:hypothetical protein